MPRYVVLLAGPAGSGKSTFCNALLTHAQASNRRMHMFNLDPAAERFEYEPSVDIRELVSLEDVMEETGLGPNGGLIYCFEYLLKNTDWLYDAIASYEEDYLLIDMPGQIELYTHFPIMSQFIQLLQGWNSRVAMCYLLESQFMDDRAKYFSGVLSALSAMVNLEVPTINVISKMDLKRGQDRHVERFLDPDPTLLLDEVNRTSNPKFHRLNEAIVSLIEEQSLVSFLPLDVTSEDSIATILSHIDNCLQYGEDEEPKEPRDIEGEERDEVE